MSSVPIGTVIDARYRILGELGRGGMGTVYEAEHVTIRKPVALKLLDPLLGRNDAHAQRFEREAFAAGRIEHPNCVTVSDFGRHEDGSLYLVMELVRGRSLADVLDDEQRFAWPRALHIARHVLRGLAHAHAAGIVHRDIKPENIVLVDHDGDPDFAKILDFGIAKLVGDAAADAGGDQLTQAGFTVGTPTYLSPEQAFGDEIDARSDLYSLSVVLYEMLAGRPPFVSGDKLAVLSMHVGRAVPPLAEVAPDAAVPPAVERLVLRGLAKRRDDRIQTAEAYIEAIDRCLAAVPAASRAPAPIATPAPAPHGRAATPGPIAPATPGPVAPAPGPAATPPPATGSAPGATAGRAAVVAPAGLPPPSGTEPTVWAPPPAAADPLARVRRWLPRVAAAVVALLIAAAVASHLLGSHDARFDALVDQLRTGKTCAERREAVLGLRELRDKRAIKELKRARYRMRGGVLGIGDRNTNKCLKADAEAAIEFLQSL